MNTQFESDSPYFQDFSYNLEVLDENVMDQFLASINDEQMPLSIKTAESDSAMPPSFVSGPPQLPSILGRRATMNELTPSLSSAPLMTPPLSHDKLPLQSGALSSISEITSASPYSPMYPYGYPAVPNNTPILPNHVPIARRPTDPFPLPHMPVPFLSMDPMGKMMHSPTALKSRKGLTQSDLEALFMGANDHPSPTRSKRDLAILCLILDLHLSSGTITKLDFCSVSSIVECAKNQQDPTVDVHYVEVLNQGSMIANKMSCHPLTAWAIYNWVSELIFSFRWECEPEMPLFVNSQPLYNSETGEKSLRKIALKRDAISKVFQSIKQRSGINCHKSVVSASSLEPLTPIYGDVITKIERESENKTEA